VKVAIIGGGVGGLTAGLDLAEAGHQVVIYEKYPVFGGLASAFPIRGNHLERFYHHIFATDLDILALVDRLGLQDRLQWTAENSGNWRKGRFASISPAWKLLFWSDLSILSRLRLAFWSKWVSLQRDWRPYDKVTAKAWILGHMGQQCWEVMWEPLFKAKFGAWADKISMTWFYGRLSARFGPAKEGAPRGCLGYIKGSTQVLVDALLERLKAKGVELRPSHAVQRLRAENGRIVGLHSKAGDEDFDRVIVTCSTPEFLGMEGGILPAPLRQDLEQFKYYGSVVAVLELKQSVSPVYWTNVLDTSKPFLAVIEHTRMIPPSEYQGAHILYLARYLDTQDAFFRAPEAEVLATYYGHLKDVCPSFDPSLVEKAHVMRADYTQPLVTPGYGSRIPDVALPIQGLFLANMTQIFPEDRGMSYSIGLGGKVAALAMQAQPPAAH
jgi:protoporphyrinogen oxidase